MWFKKKSQISGFKANKAYDGTDWRTNSNSYSGTPSHTLPSAADANNYFYLPALGHYNTTGQLYNVALSGSYWSSSAYPGNSYSAYCLDIFSGYVYVENTNRNVGNRVDGFE